MKQTTDRELDSLIMATLERQHLISDINTNVVKQLHRASRKARFVKWSKMIAVAFGVPFTVIVLAFVYYRLFMEMSGNNILMLCLAFPIMALLYGAKVAISNFSIRGL